MNDKEWFNRGQNWYCIYYACAILNEMAQYSQNGALKISNEPNIISTLLLLWKGDILSWIESRCAVKTIYGMIQSAPQLLQRFINNNVEIDLIKLAISQYGQWYAQFIASIFNMYLIGVFLHLLIVYVNISLY